MTAKEALKRIVKRSNAYGWATENTDDEIIVMNDLNRLEELEKANKSLTKELKKQDKELVKLTQALRIIKEYILKDMTVFGNDLIPFVYLQFKCGYESVSYELPFEKFCEIKEYLL